MMSIMSKKLWILHPFLFAVFPVLFLLSHNIYQTAPQAAVIPAILVLFATVIIFRALLFFLKDGGKSAFITSFFLLIFFSFGHVRNTVENVTIAGLDIGRNRYVFLIFALLFVLSVFWTVLTKKNLDKFTNVVNVIAAVLVAISIINIGMYELRHGRTARSIENTTVYESDGKFKNQGALPNIYYIILDGYAAADTLSEIYSYDNSEFLAFLADRGFFVPSKSRSNYAWTHLSLASSLNMEHITFLTDTLGIDSLDRTTPFQMIEDNAVQEFLKANDYKFIHVSSGLARMTNKNRNAEVNFKAGRLDEFSLLLLETTALYPFMKGAVGVDARNTVLYAFDVLKHVPKLPGPRFTFAHILIPHPVYLFGPNGEAIQDPTAGLSGYNRWKLKDYYVNHVIFTNKKVREVVDAILQEESTPPIILLQADHGTLSEGDEYENFSSITDRLAKERMKIFSAYYLPGDGKDMLYDSITPVNSFRIIFNHYFGTEYPLLADESYISSDKQPYGFINVTDITSEPY